MSTQGEISGSGKRGYYREPRTHDRHSMDFYIEPRWTIDALLGAEAIPGDAWDPACGCGTIPKALTDRGIHCYGTDAAPRGYGPVHDFLGMARPPVGEVASIITNPPYGVAQEFAERALSIATHKVALLVQSKFPYSQRRHKLFTNDAPAKLYFLSNRPSMPPGEKLLAGEVEAKGGKLDYMWIVWDREHVGPTEAHWLRKGAAAKSAPDLFGSAA